MAEVNLAPLIHQTTYLNPVDELLIRIAKEDNNGEVLDARDFIRGVPSDQINKFIAAAQSYVEKRLIVGADDQTAIKQFETDISQLGLPPKYTTEILPGLERNPFRRSRFTRGTFSFLGIWGEGRAWNTVQGVPLNWSIPRRGLGAKLLYPVDDLPLLNRFPYFVLGAVSSVTWGSGNFRQGNTILGKVETLEFSLAPAVGIHYPVRRWLTVEALASYGFELGRIRASQNTRGRSVLGDPCSIDTATVLQDPTSASESVGCKIKTDAALNKSTPTTVLLGVEFFDRVGVGASYLYEPLDTAQDTLAPGSVHYFQLVAEAALF